MKKLWLGMLAVIMLMLFGIYFKWVFSESLYFDKASLKYYLLVDNAVKQAPVYGDKVRYHYSAGDGSKLGSSSLFFVTRKTKKELLDRYRRHYEKQKASMSKESDGWHIKTTQGILYLRIREFGERREVEIIHF